jgi:hypothetical protein
VTDVLHVVHKFTHPLSSILGYLSLYTVSLALLCVGIDTMTYITVIANACCHECTMTKLMKR